MKNMNRKMRSLLLGTGLALLLVVAIPLLLPAFGPATESGESGPRFTTLPELWPAPAFTLTDQSGQTVTLDDLKGQVWAADFFFTSCPGICPVLSRNMQGLAADLANHPKRSGIRLVSFSLDPETDTVERLAEYAQAIDATPEQWLFLTGEKADIWNLSEAGFKLAVGDTPDDPQNPISHSGKVALVDKTGMVRGYYEGLTGLGMAELQRDLRRLIEEE